ncbi:MAG TPA: hypothetical protein VLF91_02485 [Candidatus Saccharimonadales bacterium]|nr:hypothetical protein [Candidatus Saccharimonadales bacterium]
MTKVQVKSFARDEMIVPDVDVEFRVADPKQQELVLRQSGQILLADNFGAYQQAETAGRLYTEVSDEDWQLYAGFFSEETPLKDNKRHMPDEAKTVLIRVLESRVFTSIMVRAVPETGEALIVGIHDSPLGTRRFLIYQWRDDKPVTTIEELRKRRRFTRVFVRWIHRVVNWRPEIHWPERKRKPKRQKGEPRKHGSLYFIGVALLLAGGAWSVMLLGSWWLFAAATALATLIAGRYVYVKTEHSLYRYAEEDSIRVSVAVTLVINAVAGLIFGGFWLDHWNTKDHTAKVLVCGTKDQGPSYAIKTSQGDMSLDAGFYNGTLYPQHSQTAANVLVGNWEQVTYHGYMTGDGNVTSPWVTQAVLIGPGNCGT